MNRLSNRVQKLEQSREHSCHVLLYTDSWAQERLNTEVARLKQTYATVLPLLMYEEDLVL